MRAKLIKVENEKDKRGNPIFIIIMKGADGHSYKTWTGKSFKNFTRWFRIIDLSRSNYEVWLDGLNIKGRGLVDADSLFTFEVIDTLKKVPMPQITKEEQLVWLS